MSEIVRDWLQSDSESDAGKQFDKKYFEGDRGHLRLQLQKTYKGDERFKLDDGFKVDKADRKLMPELMFGGMSKREKDALFTVKPARVRDEVKKEDSDGVQWDIDLDLAKEKAKAFDILA